MEYQNPKIKKAQNSIVIIDDFIKDVELLKDIENDPNFFPASMGESPRQLKTGNIYHNDNASVFSPWMFWDGWWRSPCDTVKKRLVKAIWEDNLPCDLDEIVGFEYWTRTYNPGQFLPTHLDEDTFIYEKNGEFRCPMIGAVYYAHFDINEDAYPGVLEVHPGRVDVDVVKEYVLLTTEEDPYTMTHLKKYYKPIGKRDIITYRPNRVVYFDAGRILHGTTPSGENSQRFIVGINVWHKDDPPSGYEEKLFFVE